MATITTRAGKGSPLTHAEVDANFNNLNTDKAETSALGTAAYTASTDYATAAQGSTADSAVQPNDSPTFVNVTATTYYGDGSNLTGVAGAYTDTDVDAHLNVSGATSDQILSWSGTDYAWVATQSVGGLFKGENGEVGSSAGDIFRVHEQTLNTSTTIDADENALCSGPLTIGTGVTLTVSGNLTVV